MPYLEFNDERDRRWRVWDTRPRSFTTAEWPGYEMGWLTFECIECDPPEEKRRLTPIPEAWQERLEVSLRELLDAAEPVRSAERGLI